MMDEESVAETAVRVGRYVGGRVGTPGQGPFMAMVLKLEGDRIIEARFQTYGCPSAIACGQYLTGWLPGKTITEASQVGAGEIAAAVGGLPLGKEFTASLAVDSLRNAIQEAATTAAQEPAS